METFPRRCAHLIRSKWSPTPDRSTSSHCTTQPAVILCSITTSGILQHRLGHLLHRLSHPEIGQNLFCATQNRVELVAPVEMLHHPSHARLGNATAAEDIDRLVRNLKRASVQGILHRQWGEMTAHLMCGARRERFEETNWSAQVPRLLLVGHLAHLVRDLF